MSVIPGVDACVLALRSGEREKIMLVIPLDLNLLIRFKAFTCGGGYKSRLF